MMFILCHSGRVDTGEQVGLQEWFGWFGAAASEASDRPSGSQLPRYGIGMEGMGGTYLAWTCCVEIFGVAAQPSGDESPRHKGRVAQPFSANTCSRTPISICPMFGPNEP